jgi:hypothetical protein
MLVSISRRKKKVKSPDAQNRSTFLKMLFGIISGDYGSKIMALYVKGDPKFAEEWKKVSELVLTKGGERAKELAETTGQEH